MAGVFSISFIRRWARSRAQRAGGEYVDSGWALRWMMWAGLQVHSMGWREQQGRQAVEDSSMGTRMCSAGHWKEEERRQHRIGPHAICMSPSVMHAGMVAFDTESWPTPKRRRGSRRRCCRAACVTLQLSVAIYEQVSQGRRRVRLRGKRCLLTTRQARAWRSRREILPSSDHAVSDCLTRTHARTHARDTLSQAQSILARTHISVTRYQQAPAPTSTITHHHPNNTTIKQQWITKPQTARNSPCKKSLPTAMAPAAQSSDTPP